MMKDLFSQGHCQISFSISARRRSEIEQGIRGFDPLLILPDIFFIFKRALGPEMHVVSKVRNVNRVSFLHQLDSHVNSSVDVL